MAGFAGTASAMLKLLLFAFSSFGYWEFFRHKTRMSIYFLPAFTICAQITVLFVAGLLNCLSLVSVLLILCGLALGAWRLIRIKTACIKPYLNWGFVFFAVACCCLLIVLKGKIFTDYDNFSHWAIVVRRMLQTDRFPNFTDTNIMFQEYPLGSSVFVYFFSWFVSSSESIMMFAQGFIMLSFILTLFVYIKKHRAVAALLMLVLTNFVFCFNSPILSLQVDTLLPLAGIATLFFLHSQCAGKDAVSVYWAIPFLCACIQIKNSGIFFVIIAVILILFYVRQHWRARLVTIVSPFLSLLLWQKHCDYVFIEAAESKHAMTVANFSQIIVEKSKEDILAISKDLLSFSVKGVELYCVLGLLLIVGVLCFILNRKLFKAWLKITGIILIVYVVYMLSIWFMYLFSMPLNEALSLASAERYRNTILIAFYCVLIAFAFYCISETEIQKRSWVSWGALFVALFLTWNLSCGGFKTVFEAKQTSKTARLWLEKVIEEHEIQPQKTYIICIPSEDAGYMNYMAKYLLNPSAVSSTVVKDAEETKRFKNYDYVILYDEGSEWIDAWVAENYPDQVGQRAIHIS